MRKLEVVLKGSLHETKSRENVNFRSILIFVVNSMVENLVHASPEVQT